MFRYGLHFQGGNWGHRGSIARPCQFFAVIMVEKRFEDLGIVLNPGKVPKGRMIQTAKDSEPEVYFLCFCIFVFFVCFFFKMIHLLLCFLVVFFFRSSLPFFLFVISFFIFFLLFLFVNFRYYYW